jgi:uncharacterized protein YaiL (DUF2058 family)
MQSLKDKLLKAGLVTEDQAKKAEVEKTTRPPARARPVTSSPPREREQRIEAPIPKLPPLATSKEANRQLARQQLELDRKIREKVLAAEVKVELGPATFHFVTRKGKLRRLELTEAQQQALESGALAVVERPHPDKIEHALVPAAIALELKVLSERTVRFLNKDGVQIGFSEETTEPEQTPAAPADDGTWLTVRRAKPDGE